LEPEENVLIHQLLETAVGFYQPRTHRGRFGYGCRQWNIRSAGGCRDALTRQLVDSDTSIYPGGKLGAMIFPDRRLVNHARIVYASLDLFSLGYIDFLA
jgi:hypothetical protein